MTHLTVFSSDTACIVWVIDKKGILAPASFRSLADFLSSDLRQAHLHTPYVFYLEDEQTHTLYSILSLSPVEKVLFYFQRNKGGSRTCIRLSKDQAFLFDPPVFPLPGIDSSSQIKSLRVELLKVILKQKRKGGALFYYFHPLLGLWQFAMVEKELLFHNVLGTLPEDGVEAALQKSINHMAQLGVENSIPIVNLSSSFSFPSTASVPHRFTPFSIILAASFLLGTGLLYNVYSIACWEKEVALSYLALRQLKAKIETPTYLTVKQEFYRHQREK
jgi:hypothetical protein